MFWFLCFVGRVQSTLNMGPDLLLLVLEDGLKYNDVYLWLKMVNWTSTKTMHKLLTKG